MCQMSGMEANAGPPSYRVAASSHPRGEADRSRRRGIIKLVSKVADGWCRRPGNGPRQPTEAAGHMLFTSSDTVF